MHARHWIQVVGVGLIMIQVDVSAPVARCFDGWRCAFLRPANRVTGDLSSAADTFLDVCGNFRHSLSNSQTHTNGVQEVPAQHNQATLRRWFGDELQPIHWDCCAKKFAVWLQTCFLEQPYMAFKVWGWRRDKDDAIKYGG